MKTRLFLLLTICVSFFMSCIENVDIKKTFDIEPQIVLICRICPQSEANYALMYSSSVFFGKRSGEDIERLKGIVEISDDGENWIHFAPVGLDGFYLLEKQQLTIEEGKTYYIRAFCDGFETVTSSCTVPYMREVNLRKSQEMLSSCFGSSINADGKRHPHEVFKWTDYPNEENYYMLSVTYNAWEYEYYYDENSLYGDYFKDSFSVYRLTAIYDNTSSSRLFTDEGRDGKDIKIINSYCEKYGSRMQGDTLFFTMMDKSCYLYEQSMINYENSIGVELMTLFEPVLVHSNIKNGLGLFGAFCIRHYSISELPQF